LEFGLILDGHALGLGPTNPLLFQLSFQILDLRLVVIFDGLDLCLHLPLNQLDLLVKFFPHFILPALYVVQVQTQLGVIQFGLSLVLWIVH